MNEEYEFCKCAASQHLICCPQCHKLVKPNAAQPEWTGSRYECRCFPARPNHNNPQLCDNCWGEIAKE